ncbi:galactose mutarotase-like domain-containing protein [Flagelloscypha sp. PMI_526]|nr:galactose mutarotase-like domain-containing protein [Flagelloscypha sp. PMI_526]
MLTFLFTAYTLQIDVLNITAPDGSAKASFISYGATATNLWVKDKTGSFRDVLIGFDNKTWYGTTICLRLTWLTPLLGIYANRIRNGTFTIPISKNASGKGKKYQVPENEHNAGTNTLHGGFVGYDRRQWNILEKSASSVTFSLLDPNGTEGFPGTVETKVTYELKSKATFDITIKATTDSPTPILLSSHNYWNLEGYKETQDLNGHIAQFKSSKIVATDGNLIPNGKFTDISGTLFSMIDFSEAKSIGKMLNATAEYEYCGTGCVGIDNAFIYEGNSGRSPAFSLWSKNSGIRLDITTEQVALQIYTCNGIYNATNPIPRKAGQGSGYYENHSCLVIEQEDIIDAINNPEYKRDQIYTPDRPYSWHASHKFSIAK